MAVRTAENDLSSIYQDLLLGNVAFPGHYTLCSHDDGEYTLV